MSKKRPSKRRPGRKTKKESTGLPDLDSSEKMMVDLSRLLAEQEFLSLDDVNDFLEQRLASGQPIPYSAAQTPLEEAQALMYDAWDAPTKAQRIKLARKALAISEDCADAYVLLAMESTKSLAQARKLYESGVEAGARSLGAEKFKQFEGHFWGVLETRPYMRAREGLAACLWRLSQRQEAIDHYHEMLRLNPGDNQGVRYTLLGCLLEEHKQRETEKLLEAYDDRSASWSYNHALFLFRQEGAGGKADARLRQALADNPHVPDYLFGYKRLPRQLPPYMGFGDEIEAAYYVTEAQHLWLQEKGALDWLREISAEST